MHKRHPQDDLLMVGTLVQYMADAQGLEPGRADRAEQLATEIASMYGLGLEDANSQIDWY